MKNLINYYYDIVVGNFKKKGNKFLFEYNNNKYEFVLFEGDLNYLNKVYSILLSNKVFVNEIILNKDNMIATLYDKKMYILMKLNKNTDFKVTFDNIVNYDIFVNENLKSDWKNLWKNKVDYYEYQINQLGFKYKKIKRSFSYYIGLTETALCLLNYVNLNNIGSYICHRRFKSDELFEDFCNPLNIVIDNRSRDFAEYIKINFLNNKIDINNALNYIDTIYLNKDEALLFLSRLLYPSYYFDIYDKVIQDIISEDYLDYYIEKNVYYETFLKAVYNKLKYKYRIPQIEWLDIG